MCVFKQMTTLEVVDSAESQAAVAYLLNLVIKRLGVLDLSHSY